MWSLQSRTDPFSGAPPTHSVHQRMAEASKAEAGSYDCR